MEALDALERLQGCGQALHLAESAGLAWRRPAESATPRLDVSVKPEGFIVPRGAKRPATPPSAKCARKMSRKSDKDDVKLETDGFAHDLLDCGDVCSDPEGERDVEDKPCPGCQRSKFTGVCWLTGDRILWSLPALRGSWCKDCFNLWRLVWGSKTNLIMFALWLEDSDNLLTWELHMLAALTIRKEGAERLTAEKVGARVASLQFVFQLSGVPLGPMQLMRFRDLTTFAELEPERLVQMLEKDGPDFSPCLGYFARPSKSIVGRQIIERPIMAGRAFLASRSAIATSSAEDVHLFAAAFPASASVSEERPDGESQHIVPVATAGDSRINLRVATTVSWAISQLHPYKTKDWTTIKESYFTITTSKFLDLKTALAHEGDEQNVSVVEEWLDKLVFGKLVTKKIRAYLKGMKSCKLELLSPSLGEWVGFLRSKKLVLHYTFLQLHLKVIFMRGAACFSHLLKTMFMEGLDTVLKDMPRDANVSSSSWLRSVFFARFSSDLEGMAVQECENRRKIWISSLEDMGSILLASSSASEVQGLASDLAVLVTMLKAGLDQTDVTVTDAALCIAAIATPRFTLLKDALNKAPAGIEFASAARELLQRRAADEVGDARLRTAMSALQDEDMLSAAFVEAGGVIYIEVGQAQLVLTGNAFVFESMIEMLSQTLDAMRVWSKVRQHEKAGDILAMVRDICKVIDIIDLVLGWLLNDLFSNLLSVGSTVGINNGFSDVDATMGHESDELDQEQTKGIMSSESDFGASQEKAYSQLISFAQSLGDGFDEAKTLLSSAARRSLDNASKRTAFLQAGQRLVQVISLMNDRPSSPEVLLADWEAEGARSVLSQLLQAKRSAEDVIEKGDFDFGRMLDNKMESKITLKYNDDVWDTGFSCSSIVTLPRAFAALWFWNDIDNTIQSAASASLSTFLQNCELDGLVSKVGVVDFTDQSLASIGAVLVKPDSMQQTKLAAVSCSAATLMRSEATLPGRSSYALLKTVLSYHGGPTIAVKACIFAEASAEVPKAEMMAMLDLYTHMHEIAGMITMVIGEMRDPSKCIAAGTVRQDLETALQFASHRCLEAQCMMETDIKLLQCAQDLARPIAWPLSLSDATVWLKTAAAVVEQIRERILNQTVQLVQSLAVQVEKQTPRYDHFINDTTFVPNLARKHLLHGCKEKELFAECVELFQSIQQVAVVAKRFQMRSPKEDAKMNDVLVHGECVFTSAKTAATVMTACRVVLVYTGQEQYDEASKLLQKWQGVMPIALVAQLASLAAKGLACAKG